MTERTNPFGRYRTHAIRSEKSYKYDENENSLTGQASKTKITVGMRAQVTLLEADETSGSLKFKLVELDGQLLDNLVSRKKLKGRKYKLRRKKRKNKTIFK